MLTSALSAAAASALPVELTTITDLVEYLRAGDVRLATLRCSHLTPLARIIRAHAERLVLHRCHGGVLAARRQLKAAVSTGVRTEQVPV